MTSNTLTRVSSSISVVNAIHIKPMLILNIFYHILYCKESNGNQRSLVVTNGWSLSLSDSLEFSMYMPMRPGLVPLKGDKSTALPAISQEITVKREPAIQGITLLARNHNLIVSQLTEEQTRIGFQPYSL